MAKPEAILIRQGISREGRADAYQPEVFGGDDGEDVRSVSPQATSFFAILSECSFLSWLYVFAMRTPPSWCPCQAAMVLKSTPSSIARVMKHRRRARGRELGKAE